MHRDPQKGNKSNELSCSSLVLSPPPSASLFSVFPLSPYLYLQNGNERWIIIQLQPLMKNSPTEVGKPPCRAHVTATDMTAAELKPSQALLTHAAMQPPLSYQ